jgi:hypothetical protein
VRLSRSCALISKQGSSTPTTEDLTFATFGSGQVVGWEVVVTVGRSALHLIWRGYADAALRTRPWPRIECARGVLHEIGSDLGFATPPNPGA